MFQNRHFTLARRHSAALLVALMALCVGATSTARAATVFYVGTGDGFYSVLYFDDEGDLTSIHYFGPDDEYFGSEWFDGDPNPEGDGTGGVVNEDAIDAALDLARKYGSPYYVQSDPWKYLFGHTSWANNKGPSVTDPWQGGALFDDGTGGSGGGGSFDPNVPFGETLPSQPGRSSDDDDDAPRRPDPADAYDFDPDVIDPSPESAGWNGDWRQ
jgi:hypothetical protein